MSTKPYITNNAKKYLHSALGEKLASIYFDAIITPMTDYTLHFYSDYDLIDNVSKEFEKQGFKNRINEKFNNLLVIKPKGPFKIKKDNNIKTITVDNIASEMIYQGADLFVPGIKRISKISKGTIVNIQSQNKVFVAEGFTLMNHVEISSKEHGIAVKNIKSPYQVPSKNDKKIKNSSAYFQSIPSYLVSLNLEPKKGDTILDACAAPGGKTLHISEITQNQSKIIAIDRSSNRLSKLKEKIKKLKLQNISCIVGDILKITKDLPKFDKILVDPPCSALGVRPRLHFDVNKKQIQDIANYQKAILTACNERLKENGTIIYSTCSITPEENEEVIMFAQNKLNLKVVEPSVPYSSMGSIKADFTFPVLRFIPGVHKTAGFFISKLKKD